MANKTKKGSSKKITKKQAKTIRTLIYIDIAIFAGILIEFFIFCC